MTDAPHKSVKPKRILHGTKVSPVHRLIGIRRVSNGESPTKVARQLGCACKTLLRWWREYNFNISAFDEMVREVQNDEAQRATQEMAKHVVEAELALTRIEEAVSLEKAKLERARRGWLANNLLAQSAKSISALLATR